MLSLQLRFEKGSAQKLDEALQAACNIAAQLCLDYVSLAAGEVCYICRPDGTFTAGSLPEVGRFEALPGVLRRSHPHPAI